MDERRDEDPRGVGEERRVAGAGQGSEDAGRVISEDAGAERPPLRAGAALRALRHWAQGHSRLLWAGHSLWALASGVFVVMLARERYGFAPWIGAMLALTWVSTLVFSRWRGRAGGSRLGRLGGSFVSYLTRMMYQDTLFFLLPFYAYSTPLTPQPGWTALFLAVLAGLALLSCLDLVFDRMLRDYPPLAFLYFSAVTFAALCFLLPVIFAVPLAEATVISAWAAVLSGVPLSLQGGVLRSRRGWVTLAVALLGVASVPRLAPIFVPPVPLRLQDVSFAQGVARGTLELQERLESEVSAGALAQRRIAAMARIFAPTVLPAQVRFVWELDGQTVRSSREVQIVGHEGGFRVWDALRFDGAIPPGLYELSVFVEDRLLGQRELRVRPAARATPSGSASR